MTSVSHKHKNRSPLTIALALFVGFSFVAAGFVFWKNVEADHLIKSQQEAITTQNQKIKRILENQQVGAKTKAQEILRKAEKYRVNWSEVAQKIFSELESEEVQFQSVSATENRYISAKGKAQSLRSIARLIAKIRQHKNFSDPFVSTLSQGDEAKHPFSFSITFYYLES